MQFICQSDAFTFMHLADAFIQATYSAFRLYMFYHYVCSLGIEPTTFALLTQCSTTEPQEHRNNSTLCMSFVTTATAEHSFRIILGPIQLILK